MNPATPLDPYELLAPLGAGGMGEVWRARDPRLGREVAIKVLPEAFGADPDHLARFEQEAKALAALSHPNILTLFELGMHKGSPYLVTELLEGETLRACLKKGPLPIEAVLDLALQMTRGLAAAHAKGIVHRDLKPENAFLTRDGAKLLDFGLAKQTAPFLQTPQSQLPTQGFTTGEGTLLGTLSYMSPEQVRGEAVDARSDLFSLGALLCEVLTGRSAFACPTPADTLSAILTRDPEDLESLIRQASPALHAVLRRCLEKRREDRFSSAQDLLFALQAVSQPSTPAREPAEEEKSIVVLPFENLSPDPSNAYFADGLMEELIADLSKIQALRVISRTSAMHFKGTDKALPEIARALKVRYVLEGSVRRAGNSLRITAQLIEAATDMHLWAEKYSGTIEDVFAIQEQVSRSIVDALKIQLTATESRRLVERPTRNPAMYECFLLARAQILRFEPAPLEQALSLLAGALDRSPHAPLLMACKAYAHWQRVNIGCGAPEDLEQARALAEEALAVLPELPLGHSVLGLVAGSTPDGGREAVQHLAKALQLNPSDMDALFWLSVANAFLGRTEAAAALSGRMISIGPLDFTSYVGLYYYHRFEGRLEEALEVADQQLLLAPGAEPVQFSRIPLLLQLGRLKEAAALAAWAEHSGDSIIRHHIRLAWHAHQHHWDEALALLSPDLLEASRTYLHLSLPIAEAYAQMGEHESSLDWLERTIHLGLLNHPFMARHDSLLNPLHGLPRFEALMEAVHGRARALEAFL